MHRSTRLALAVFAALLMIVGAYTAYWFYVAGQIRDGIAAWAKSAKAEKIEASWQRIHVGGFPTAFRVELETAALRDNAVTPSPEVQIPSLSGIARPWYFADWRLMAPLGFVGTLAGSGDRAAVKLAAQGAHGLVSIEPEGGWKLWLRVDDANLEAAGRVRINAADTWIAVPPTAPHTHTDSKIALAGSARQVELPVAISPLGSTIDELDVGLTVKGAISDGKLADVAAAWRDAGGTIELDRLRLIWGGLGATAAGTIALDQQLQPIAGFSGAIQGYDSILSALVESGRMRATDAGLARIALTMLAKAGPDGKPEIKTAFTIQNGQMFLGPVKLGKVPHLAWN
jgi:hypothetical protein